MAALSDPWKRSRRLGEKRAAAAAGVGRKTRDAHVTRCRHSGLRVAGPRPAAPSGPAPPAPGLRREHRRRYGLEWYRQSAAIPKPRLFGNRLHAHVCLLGVRSKTFLFH